MFLRKRRFQIILERTLMLLCGSFMIILIHTQVPASQNLVKDVHNKIHKTMIHYIKENKKPHRTFVQPLAVQYHVDKKEYIEDMNVIDGMKKKLFHQLKKEKNTTYVPKLEKLMKGVLVPPSEVVTPVPGAINLGLIIIHIESEKKAEEEVTTDSLVLSRYGFSFKCMRTLRYLMERAGVTPIHFIIVTNSESSSFAGKLVATGITKRLAMDVILTRDFLWRRHKSIPPVYFSLVDSDMMLDLNPGFAEGMWDNQMATKADDKYRSKFYFIAPNYHLAFTSLDKAVFIDATDLEITCDVKDLWDQYEDLDKSTALMSVGLDLAPHYFMFLGDYIKENPDTPFGQPGRFQGFNTGVVLYRFDRMRESKLYNQYLTREKVNEVIKKFKFEMSLAEQDYFTELGFIQPEFFHVLPCEYNRQESVQYNRPPYEEIFPLYHDCKTKEETKIFHLNGCGPTPAQCGHKPQPHWKGYASRHKSQFLHMDIEMLWASWAYKAVGDDTFMTKLLYQDAVQLEHLGFHKNESDFLKWGSLFQDK